MEWQQIKGFHAVARLGSFTRAAKSTLRSQSAVSQQVAALEEELGCRLLERIGRRGLRLTPAGRLVLEFCSGVLERQEHLGRELGRLKGLEQGSLRIAAPFTTLYQLLPPVLSRYLKRHPLVELTLLDRTQPEVVELVRRDEVDLGLALASAAPRDLAQRRWKRVRPALLVPQDHPLAGAARITLRQAAAYPLILPPWGPPPSHRAELERRLQELGVSYRVVLESANVELSALYVEMGLGIAFATVVQDPPLLRGRKLSLVSLGRRFKGDHLAVLTRRGRRLASHQRAFVDMLAPPPAAPA